MAFHDTRLARVANLNDDQSTDEDSLWGLARSPNTTPDASEKSLRDYLAVILKRKWLIASIVLMTTTVAVIYVFSLPSKYDASTTLRVQPKEFTFTEDGHGTVFQNSDNYEFVNTQIKLLSNPQLIRQVVARLNLQNNPAFLAESRQIGFVSSVKQFFSRSKPATALKESTPSADTHGSNETFTVEQMQRLEPYVNTILAHLKIEQEKYTNLINIQFTHTDPELAMKVVDTLADTFVAKDNDYETSGTRKGIAALGDQIATLETEIRQKEDQRLAYMKTHNLPLADRKGRNLTAERVAMLSEQLLTAENDRKNLESIYQTANQTKDIFSIQYVRGSKEVQETESSIRELEQKRASLGATYTLEWPEVKKIDAQLSKVREHLDYEGHQAIASLKANLDAAVAREAKLRAAYNQEQESANGQSQDEIELANLNQRLETSKQLDYMLIQRQKEIEVNALNKSDMVMIVNRPSLPTEPVAQQRWSVIAMAFVLSLLAGVVLAFLLNNLDTVLHSVEDVFKHAQLTSLAIIPSFPRGPLSGLKQFVVRNGKDNNSPLALMEDVRSVTAEAYRQLRTSLLFSFPIKGPKSILVTSGRPLEGKTTTVINLAITFAQSGSNVLVIDCDMRRPKVHSHLNIPNQAGLTTYLSGQGEIGSLIQSCAGHPNLKVLTSGPPPANPADLFGSDQMRDLLSTMGQFAYIILDSPPAIGFADVGILASLVDGVMIVVHGQNTSRATLQRVKQRLLELGANIYGVVLNHADPASHERFYGDYYGYYQSGEEQDAI